MWRVLVTVVGLIGLSKLIYGQTDWGALLHDLTSHNPVVADPARDRTLGQIVPKLCTEGEADATTEIPGLLKQLASEDDSIRLQASGILYVVSKFGPILRRCWQ